MIKILLSIGAAVLISGLFWYLFFYKREKRLLERLQEMLDQAEEGRISLEEISEEKISALENSFKCFLDNRLLAGENQQKQKDVIQELISDISHQTLTPISNLKIYTELLKEEMDNESEIVDTIQEQTEKLDFLIQSLVKLSRMENGIITVHPEENEISGLFGTVRQEYEAKAKEKDICLKTGRTDIKAKFDMKWTVEALGNLVDNAIKYSPCGGKVTLTAEKYTFFIRIDVADHGIGMDEEELPKIFGRFYRSLCVSDQPGVGVGLYLAREIIEAQKGYIKAVSQKGRGSVFSVFLPTVTKL